MIGAEREGDRAVIGAEREGDRAVIGAERDPVRVGDAIRDVVDASGWRDRLAVGRLSEGWARVVGTQIAAHSTPLKLAAGVLLVRAEPGAWASELALLAPTVAGKADAFLGGGLVTEVKVVARA